jgi:hypothetical protein
MPDDWNCYYTTCGSCNGRYHMSEGGCDCTADLEDECPECSGELVVEHEYLHCTECEWQDHLLEDSEPEPKDPREDGGGSKGDYAND